jgi:hypothetical protein
MLRTCGVGAIVLASMLGGTASAGAALLLKSGGQVAPVGTPVHGVLSFGPCGTFEAEGTLTVNSSSPDKAKFSSTTGGAGGCGEGGPIISGTLLGNRLTEAGRFVEMTKLIYRTQIPQACEYSLKSLAGKFAIPGLTKATVAGTAKRTATSSPSCAEKLHVTGVEAALYDRGANALFEAEL